MKPEFFTKLPSEIIISILSRLPVRTIVHCKCVCKSWLVLLETLEFVKSHLSISVPGLAVYQSELNSKRCKIFEFVDGLGLEHHELHYNLVTNFNVPLRGELRGSANGLLFLHDLNPVPGGLYICNPITRDYIKLHCPQGFVSSDDQVVTYGFGASKITGQHKVAMISHDCVIDPVMDEFLNIPKCECQVYTLGTGSWRSIAPISPFNYIFSTNVVFLNGNLHWLVGDSKGSLLISCFDLEAEVFSTFTPPPPLQRHERYPVVMIIFALGDYLCLSDNTSDDDSGFILLMKEYGAEKSWTKFVINKLPVVISHEVYAVVYPIKVFKDGDILMVCEDFFLYYYSKKNESNQRIDIFEADCSINAILHTPSFVSLKSFEMENVTSF